MRKQTFGSPTASTNPLVNFVMIVVGALVAAGALILGFITFTVIAGIILVLACVVAVRVWWFKKTMMRQPPPSSQSQSQPSRPPTGTVVIEGEYREVKDKADSTD